MPADLNILINGMGVLGREILRKVVYDKKNNNYPIGTIIVNDPYISKEKLMYLLKYDSMYTGTQNGSRFYDSSMGEIEERGLIDEFDMGFVNIKFCQVQDIGQLPCGSENIHFVIDCLGLYKTTDTLNDYLSAGASKVMATYPVNDYYNITPVVCGFIDRDVRYNSFFTSVSPEVQVITILLGVLDKNDYIDDICGIVFNKNVTNKQTLLDFPINESEFEYSRSGIVNQYNAGSVNNLKVVGNIILESLMGKVKSGYEMRIAGINGSCCICSIKTKHSPTVDEINVGLKNYQDDYNFSYTSDHIVSNDVMGKDTMFTFVAGETQLNTYNDVLQILVYYDPVSSYASQILRNVYAIYFD